MKNNHDNEQWLDVKDFEGLYQVSNYSRLKHLPFYVNVRNQIGDTHKKAYHKERLQKPRVDKDGYNRYTLCKNMDGIYYYKYVIAHRLAAETFIPDKTTFKSLPNENRDEIDLDKLEINHKDENKQNNYIGNLEWCTPLYNLNYGTRIERIGTHGRIKIIQKDKNNHIIKIWEGLTIASKELHINAGGICWCCKGKAKSAGGYLWEYYKEVKDE